MKWFAELVFARPAMKRHVDEMAKGRVYSSLPHGQLAPSTNEIDRSAFDPPLVSGETGRRTDAGPASWY